MADEFASALRRMLAHPKCKGLTFFPTNDGRWQVSVAVGGVTNWNVNIEANPLVALWKCMQRLELE